MKFAYLVAAAAAVAVTWAPQAHAVDDYDDDGYGNVKPSVKPRSVYKADYDDDDDDDDYDSYETTKKPHKKRSYDDDDDDDDYDDKYKPTKKPKKPSYDDDDDDYDEYKTTKKPKKHKNDDYDDEYKTTKKPAKKYATTTPKPTAHKGELEFKQFWNAVDYCDAELGLVECLLDTNVVRDFATTKRVGKCVKKFATGLCRKLAPEGCSNGRVSLTKQNCVNNAVVAALYAISDVQSVTIGGDETPVDLFKSDNPDSFTGLKNQIALQGLVNYGACLGGSLLNYADTCNAKSYFSKDTNKCVSHILAHCSNDVVKNNIEENDYRHKITLGSLLSQNTLYTDKQLHDRNHDADPNDHSDKSELELLGNLIAQSSAVNIRPIGVNYVDTGDINRAELTVCPNSFTAINQRVDPKVLVGGNVVVNNGGIQASQLGYDLPGFPLDDLAFHFPAQTYDNDNKKFVPLKYPKGTDNQFPEGTAYDPITPEKGIQDTCEHFYTLSLLAWFAGKDTGDYCFSIDKYSVEFVETGQTEDLLFEQLTETGPSCNNPRDFNSKLASCRNDIAALNAATTKEAKAAASTQLALDQAWILANDAPTKCSQCYKVSWNDPAYCPRHLTRFRMHTRCCKSFQHVMDDIRTTDKTRTRVEKGTYSPEWDECPKSKADLEFTAIIYSEAGKGELKSTKQLYQFNSDGYLNKLVDLWSIFQGAVLKLSQKQQQLFLNALKFFNCNDNGIKDVEFCFNTPAKDSWKKTHDHYERNDDNDDDHYYLDRNEWCKEANSQFTAQVNWGQIIATTSSRGTCYNPSCLLSRYVDCSERPPVDKETYQKHNRYVPPYVPKDGYYARSMLSSIGSTPINWMMLSTGGFVMGVLAVAMGQFALKSTRRGNDVAVPYRQIM